MLRSLPIVLIRLAEDGTILDAKGQDAAALLGANCDPRGRRLWDTAPDGIAEPLLAGLQRLREGAELVGVELALRVGDGQRWYEAKLSKGLGPEVIVVVCAVTDRRRFEEQPDELLMQEQLARAQAELAQQRTANILESITSAFFALDRAWRFTYVNGEAEHLLQRSRGELLGKRVWEGFPRETSST